MSRLKADSRSTKFMTDIEQIRLNPYIKLKNKTELMALYNIHRIHNYKMVFPNIYTTDLGEIDCLHITGSGYAYYYEVKASKSDFKNDFKKPRHKILSKKGLTKSWKPKQFIYILHGFTLEPEELPEYAGAYIMDDKGFVHNFEPLKKPPIIYNEKINLVKELPKIYKKMSYRYLDSQYMLGRDLIRRKGEEVG